MKSLAGRALEHADETQLLQQAQDGDAEAFGVLYSRHLEPIYRYVYFRVDSATIAEDLTEEVFVRAWEALPTYEVGSYPITSWLYRIAHNLIIDHRRKLRPDPIKDEILQAMPAPAASPEQLVVDGQDVEALFQAVQKLEGEEQQVVILRFVEGLSHREVANAIGKSEEASRVIQFRAIQRLQSYLSEQEGSDE